MAVVKLENIKKAYENGFVAVHDFNLDIADKEFIVLVGPSGCGKTTTLRMIAGLEEISSGILSIDGKKMNEVHPKDRDIAMVFQNYALYPHMNVFDNMAFGLKLRKFPKNEIKERVEEAARILSIEKLLDRKPKQLSGGQRQRVAVGRAIVRKPKVFLFDEPLSNLDAKLRVQMRTEISKLHKKLEATMVYVTHDQTEAMTMGDRIVVMKDGYVQQIDSPLNLYNNPANKFVAGFIGSPSMNFIEGKIVKEGAVKFISSKNGLTFQIKANSDKLEKYIGSEVTIGVRPEDIQPTPTAVKIDEPVGFSGNVEVVEPMGNETFVYFTIDDMQYVSRTAPGFSPGNDGKSGFAFSLDKVFYFNKEEKRIC